MAISLAIKCKAIFGVLALQHLLNYECEAHRCHEDGGDECDPVAFLVLMQEDSDSPQGEHREGLV